MDELLIRQTYTEARNGLHFIQGATAKAQPAPGHFCNRQPTSGYGRFHHQGCFVSYPTCGVFVHFNGDHIAQIHYLPGMRHGQG
ncbi:hypothetical protein SDC9_175192 [bioreactor metagenome]|uniref:Uncharacterized protein n=1 Tax=bioreactor metagenome TaxID=1076179 RepID=A0A645GLF4_9ZZZZ